MEVLLGLDVLRTPCACSSPHDASDPVLQVMAAQRMGVSGSGEAVLPFLRVCRACRTIYALTEREDRALTGGR